MGHTDTIVIGDCGLPVPPGVKKIDLALKLGTPRFLEVVEEVAKYMEIEKIHIAAEMQSHNEECWQKMHEMFGDKEWIVTDHEHCYPHRRNHAVCQCNFTFRRNILIKRSTRYGNFHARYF